MATGAIEAPSAAIIRRSVEKLLNMRKILKHLNVFAILSAVMAPPELFPRAMPAHDATTTVVSRINQPEHNEANRFLVLLITQASREAN